MHNTVNIRDYGAVGDGRHDDAPAIQAAMDSLRDTGGLVYMPAGFYRMGSGVVVPLGVTVTGVTTATTGPWQNFLDTRDKGLPLPEGMELGDCGEQWLDPRCYKGTWVLSDHGRGEADGAPTFRLEGNSALLKVGFVNRWLPPVSDEFVPCPPNVAHISTNTLPRTREGVTIEDISLANCYCGVMIAAGDELDSQYPDEDSPMSLSKSCGRHRIRNIMGGPLYRGVVLKALLDTVDVANCQFNYSNYNSLYCQIRSERCVDILLVRGDGIILSDCLSFGAYSGMMTLPSFRDQNGTCSFRLINSNFESTIPLALYGGGMMEVANCYFLAIHPIGYNEGAECACIQLVQSNSPHQPFIAISNSVLQNGVGDDCCMLDVELTGGSHPALSNCQFWGWGANTPAVRLKKTGSSPASLTLSGCVFTGKGGALHSSANYGGRLAETGGEGCHDGDLQFIHCRMPAALYDAGGHEGVWFDGCVAFADDGNRRIAQSS